MEQGTLDVMAQRYLDVEDETPEGMVVNALELAICALSKNPVATDILLGKLIEAISDADEKVFGERVDD